MILLGRIDLKHRGMRELDRLVPETSGAWDRMRDPGEERATLMIWSKNRMSRPMGTGLRGTVAISEIKICKLQAISCQMTLNATWVGVTSGTWAYLGLVSRSKSLLPKTIQNMSPSLKTIKVKSPKAFWKLRGTWSIFITMEHLGEDPLAKVASIFPMIIHYLKHPSPSLEHHSSCSSPLSTSWMVVSSHDQR